MLESKEGVGCLGRRERVGEWAGVVGESKGGWVGEAGGGGKGEQGEVGVSENGGKGEQGEVGVSENGGWGVAMAREWVGVGREGSGWLW